MKKLLLFLSFTIFPLIFSSAQSINESFISFENGKGKFAILVSGKPAPLLISSNDWPGVIRAFKDLQSDIGKITSNVPELFTDNVPRAREIIIAGTIGKNVIIDKLVNDRKIDVKGIAGQWETFLIQVVNKPLPGVKRALIIAGSDKRGTIYGIYEISRQIGISPWYWWADVPVLKKNAIYVNPGGFSQGSPSVRYRGIFLNDEAPDLTNWIREKFGLVAESENPPVQKGVANYGHEFYTKLFELILRLKGNYLWPAMWNNAFNEDDPENPKLADEYGIVMGNSHQEPMLRAQKEWDRRYIRKIGTWNYAKNPDILEAFWRDGIKRNKNYESIVTIGLRGANDTEMDPGGPQANMQMLEKIVDVQRKILTDEIKTDITKIPQLWCLYKEVQDYYKAGMRVPEDVTLLWAEDNWGNIRRLPTAEERKRSGGAGIYYHFDYHGGPRSYQWLNTSPLAKIWDQMTLTKQYGADRIWIVNVGHFKGYELAIEYFLDLAWNTEKQTSENIDEYTELWAARQFGKTYSKEIGEILSAYTKYNGRRKPELLSPSTYSLVNYREAERVVEDYKTITLKAEEIFNKLPSEMHDAFYQLVLFPTKASALVNELYLAAGKNDLYARQGRASTNDMANQTRLLFQTDTSLMGYFNRDFANGKWKHFMDQSHLGYTTWADPPVNSLRAIKLKESEVPDIPAIGVSIEGSEAVWPGEQHDPVLPEFDIFNRQSRYIDIFNKGKGSVNFSASSDNPWIVLKKAKGTFGFDERIWVTVDWDKVPKGKSNGSVKIKGTENEITVIVNAFNPTGITPRSLQGFVEGEGYVSIEAEHFTRLTNEGTSRWIRIENYGHTLSAMRASAETDAAPATPGKNSPCLEYQMFLFSTGAFDITSIFSPTLNFMAGRALQYAISFDNEAPKIITLVPEDYNARNGNTDWEKSVSDNARFSHSTHIINTPGYHTLKIFMVDPGVVLQKIIVNSGGLKPSYLGPPESYFKPANPEK
jgi:Glycosyl hydrolase family 115/Gylcosyl hydrolase family 115 C-terminal domain